MLDSLAAQLIDRLKADQGRICTIESCTGGLVASLLTDIPGASSAYWGSLVTYDASAKISLAQVPCSTLDTYGTVSSETARAMAANGLEVMRNSLSASLSKLDVPYKILVAIAITGTAGPGGGTLLTPVGLAYLGIAVQRIPSMPGHLPTLEVLEVFDLRVNPTLSRDQIKRAFAEQALQKTLEQLTHLKSSEVGII